MSEIMVRHDVSLLGEQDLHLFNEGTHNRLYQKLGARHITVEGVSWGVFAVWAPNALQVSVIGDFNFWKKGTHPLRSQESLAFGTGFIPGISHGATTNSTFSPRGMTTAWISRSSGVPRGNSSQNSLGHLGSQQ